jgi:hypothetical protein
VSNVLHVMLFGAFLAGLGFGFVLGMNTGERWARIKAHHAEREKLEDRN